MPKMSGPFTPTPNTPFTILNPFAGAGSPYVGTVVVINYSPYALVVTTDDSVLADLIDPFTRDGMSLDLSSEGGISIDPLNVGFNPPAGVTPQVYALWYSPYEPGPGSALPAPIVPYGNLQTVSVAALVAGTTGHAFATVQGQFFNGNVVLPPPPAGQAYYLRSFDAQVPSPDSITLQAVASGGFALAGLNCPIAGRWANHPGLNDQRVTTGVWYFAQTVNQAATIILRYDLGS
ncbi:MAG: hypothetical protein JWM85_388 [Acidimicrobiaceae bacterium]|nr:hypothetical protein [Acidimicrobiaceae bacterium]